MSPSDGNVINDTTCNNHDFALTPDQAWASTGSAVDKNLVVEKADHFLVPGHTLATPYAYNSLNQVVKQTTPDAGTTEFWYDRLGRLAVLQNEEQKSPAVVDANNPANRFSYTNYDASGRITE